MSEKLFTTEPKTRRHVRHSISGDRCRYFLQYLWQKGFKKECKYEGLRIQFIQYFETNDDRVIIKYIGRPKLTVTYSREQVLRRKQSSSGASIARFEYAHKREAKPKTGLMEMLGYMTLDAKTGYVALCHENMPYYTVQTSLTIPPAPPLPKSNECYQSIDDSCVCPIDNDYSPLHTINKGRLSDRRGQRDSEWETENKRREREEYRQHTHKSFKQTIKPEEVTV